MLVLTDIEADPDDAQSLIRFLLYSNQFDVEGLVATTSIHQKTRVAPESILKVLEAYGKVHPNLIKHEQGYPTKDELKSKVKKGLATYGMEGVGEGKDSEGSEWIIKALEKEDDRPLWISVWGGPNTLAQALWKIKKTKSATAAERLYKKLRVYTISDQDDSGPWIRKNFPSVFYVVTPGYNYTKATWLGITMGLPGSNAEVVSTDWLAKNIQQGHGPLGAAYPDVAYGMEGDTPAFLNLISNGLNDSEHPNFGGGVDAMNSIFQNLKTRTRVRSEEKTGQRMNPKQDQSGLTQMTRLFLCWIRSHMLVTGRPSGAGARNFRMILLHE